MIFNSWSIHIDVFTPAFVPLLLRCDDLRAHAVCGIVFMVIMDFYTLYLKLFDLIIFTFIQSDLLHSSRCSEEFFAHFFTTQGVFLVLHN